MDFYNLQESDHKLLEEILQTGADDRRYRDYVRRQFFSLGALKDCAQVLVVEEDLRLQKIIERLIQEENPKATCTFVSNVSAVEASLEGSACELLIANYYSAEDEVEYDFWEDIRARYPRMEVVILSHVNDRDIYEMLEKIDGEPVIVSREQGGSRLKKFLGNVLGGWYGTH